MTAIPAEIAVKNLYELIAEVNRSYTPVTITSIGGKNAVLLSEDDWNAIQKTVYLNSIPGLADSLLSARKDTLSDCTVYDEDEAW